MSRYRLIFDGEFPSELGARGVGEAVAMRLEDMGDVRLVKVYNCLAGCLVCQHGEPVEGSFYGRVRCLSCGGMREPTDHCMRFVQLDVMDKRLLRDPQLAAEVERRIDKFNRLVQQDR